MVKSEEGRAKYRQCAPGFTRVRMHISYDGTDFTGWQRQTTLVSVQGTIEAALSQIAAMPITVIGASRTDTGVHAIQQVAHFDCPRDPDSFHDLRYAIQCMTPKTVVVEELFVAPRDFHAIASSLEKSYVYRVFNRRVPSALSNRYSHWVRFPLSIEFLNRAAEHLVGQHDFKSFQSSGTIVKSTFRTIHAAGWRQVDENLIEFEVRGDGFLKQMVRNLVGTMIDLNQAEADPAKMREILAQQDRRKAGTTAPPQGLFLKQVKYPEYIDIKCRKL